MSDHRPASAMSVQRIDQLDESLLRDRLRRTRVARIGYVGEPAHHRLRQRRHR
jgi:hypothetical protein